MQMRKKRPLVLESSVALAFSPQYEKKKGKKEKDIQADRRETDRKRDRKRDRDTERQRKRERKIEREKKETFPMSLGIILVQTSAESRVDKLWHNAQWIMPLVPSAQ